MTKYRHAPNLIRTRLINRKWCAEEWRVAGKARRRSIALCSVTEEQRGQRSAIAQPEGGQIFQPAAALLVGRRSVRIFFLLAPCHSLKSLATHSFLFMRWVLIEPEPSPYVRKVFATPESHTTGCGRRPDRLWIWH